MIFFLICNFYFILFNKSLFTLLITVLYGILYKTYICRERKEGGSEKEEGRKEGKMYRYISSLFIHPFVSSVSSFETFSAVN